MLIAEYSKILFVVFLLVSVLIFLFLICYYSSNNYDSDRLSPYECGFEAFDDFSVPFEVQYYRTAILFIIFDVEIIFLFPAAASESSASVITLLVVILFLLILLLGFVYEWLKGGLEWD